MHIQTYDATLVSICLQSGTKCGSLVAVQRPIKGFAIKKLKCSFFNLCLRR